MNDTTTTAREQKASAVSLFRSRYTSETMSLMSDIDSRLAVYFDGIDREPTQHNIFEVLSAARFLRIYRENDFDSAKLRLVLRLGEGEWEQTPTGWQHIGGGIKQPGTPAPQVYRWQPFQVFVLASIFGSRRATATGTRRLTTDFTFFAPRKTNKTGLAAFIQVVFFLLEDIDAEIYCCANASGQSKILYERTRSMLRQLDDGGRIRQTSTVCDWRDKYKNVRNSVIRPLSAGGKTKDGMFAQLCCADEYGSAPWVKGHCDMKSLVDVIQSSMGPRREPLTLTTTTAGTITAGPFVEKLDALHRLLLAELDADADHSSTDYMSCLLLEPDAWERDEETLLTSAAVRRKVNPMLGTIVQESFYEEWAARCRLDPSNLGEYVTKLFNVYRADAVSEWITPDHVRRLQIRRRIDDCKADDGWLVFVGMDFSLGDDLHAISYLGFSAESHEFFADCDAWITERTLECSAMRHVFERWLAEGWLNVSPGETLAPELPINRIAYLLEHRHINFVSFGYDTYKAKQPINALTAYLYDRAAAAGYRMDTSAVVLPCRQNYATFNPLVLELDAMVKADPPMIRFSSSPLWPWEAGNMILDVSSDGMENRKPRKRRANDKIDNWICLLEALRGFDIADGAVG